MPLLNSERTISISNLFTLPGGKNDIGRQADHRTRHRGRPRD